MGYPSIFYQFDRKESTTDGISIYDFLGGAINATYKYGWMKNVVTEGKKVKPNYPSLSEWTIDWIACLVAAKIADDKFNVIELGAGYGQWMVTSILAFKSLNPKGRAHGLAIEADPIHYKWLLQHVQRNVGNYHDVVINFEQAAAGVDGIVEFPIIDEPSKNYGASYIHTPNDCETIKVKSLSLPSIYRCFGEIEVDLLHIDIQGAEDDLICHPDFTSVLRSTRIVLIGTHRSQDLHEKVLSRLVSAGFVIKVNWPRNSNIRTIYGSINSNDGAILAVNSQFSETVDKIYNFLEVAHYGD